MHRPRQQLHLVAVVAAPAHAYAHDIAGAGLLGDRRDLIGLERLQVEPGRAVRRKLANARAHALTDAQHVVAGVHEAAREIAGAHAPAALGQNERGRARVERDDLALDVVADGEVLLRLCALDAERREQRALGLALAPLEGVDARMHRGAVVEREAGLIDARRAAPHRELVAERVAQRVGRLAGLDEHDLRAPAEAPRQRSRLDERATVPGRDHDLRQLALRRQKPEMDVLAHFLRWQPDVELVRGPCRHVGSLSGRDRFLPPSRKHLVERLQQPVGIAALEDERRLELEHVHAVARRLHDRAPLAQPLADRVAPPRARAPWSRGRARGRARGRGPCRARRRRSRGGATISSRPARRAPPTTRAFSCRRSSSSTSSTARPISHETGPPPTEAKNPPWPASASAIAPVVITAATGWPLPVAFAIVTMSGTTPCCSKPQKCAPSRP